MPVFLRLLLVGFFLKIGAGAFAGVAEISPTMGEAEINKLLNSAGPGDTLLFHPGTYRGPFILSEVHGDVNQPVVITGVSTSEDTPTVIDGQSEPGSFLKHQAFLLQDCSWISIEHFTIKNCWTDLIYARDVSYLSIRHCNMTGGKRALFATGRGSHHFLVEHCNWEQDEKVWTHSGDYSWEQLHHGVHKHFNGSLFQGSEISGVFVLRDNLIKNTFNAFRLSQIKEGAMDLLACTNGEIYRNTIINTSDNVLEPELYTKNLHFYHNRMINGHAFVSITEVAGGEIYIYGNTALSRPESDDGWTIFKISSKKKGLTKPLYIFNNSWFVDFDMIGSPHLVWSNNHVRHFNNACYSVQSDSFGIYHLGLDNHFNYDCSNVPFPGLLSGNGFEKNGLVENPLFRDPIGNDFRLKNNSPCIDRGIMDSTLILGYRGEGPDMGAYDNGELIQGLPFKYMSPGPEVPYKEMPRISRYETDEDKIRVWFSVPLAEASVKSTNFKMKNGKNLQDLKVSGLTEDGYCLTFSAAQNLEDGGISLIFSHWPEGKNGMPVTSWASALPVSLYGQQPLKVLETTRNIANKIIRETLFDYKMVPLSYNGGITQFAIEEPDRAGNSGVYYAYEQMNSELDTSGILGISFSGVIRIILNGEVVFSGFSKTVGLQEYTYNRYRFQHNVPVQWKKGVNEILVKCAHGKDTDPVALLMLPIDNLDAKAPFVNTVLVTEDSPKTHWLICGPWVSQKGKTMNQIFPPEVGFEDFYNYGEKIMGWKLEEAPLLRELVIPESNSYQRDAYADWHYANGGTMLGILSLYDITGDQKYVDFVKRFADNMWENDAYFRWQYFNHHAMRGSFHRVHRMTMLDDSGGPALPFAQLQLIDSEYPGYLPVLDRTFEYVINGQERLNDRTFSRPEPEPATVWADDLFMAVPFLLRMAKIKGDQTLYDEVAQQVILFNKYLSDPETGLYFHGWYDKRQENTPVRWGRANGWVIWATSEALMYLPKKHPDYKTILKIYKTHMEALAGYQDKSGMWHQVLDHPDTYEETSCTAMFTLGLARGVRMGWLKERYRENAINGWKSLQKKILTDGTVKDICRGTEIGENVDFYENRKRFDHDPRGLGAMLTAGCEISLLLNQ